ncbi:MAG: hypothetical protein Q4G58_17375 [bacterium]|nr:hypothetical protein [bacterium]
MSAFLGPIHYWLYNKIMIQENLVEMILKLNEIEGYVPELENDVNRQCGMIERKPLEDMIDTGNIHGWLQERIIVVEKRLSFVVTAIVKDDQERMEQILDVAYQMGEETYLNVSENETLDTAEKVYKAINDMLLDGMPCDRINELLASSDNEVVYRQSRCIHETYWVEIGGLVMHYYDIRRKFLQGFLEKSAFEFVVDEQDNFKIRRK